MKTANKKESAPGAVSAELEQLCAAVPQVLVRTGAGLEERYYVQLAEEALEAADKSLRSGQPNQTLEKEVRKELSTLHRSSHHLLQSYQILLTMEDELNGRLKDMRSSRHKKWYVPNPPANAAIDLAEAKRLHFAQGLNLYKLLLICFVGSFAGVVMETIWCLVRYGFYESRAGLVYGPFNLLYGAGAVLLTLALYQYRNRGPVWSFLGGFLVGSALEYICSWGQEALLGSRSWDYSAMPLNINGRICLMYSFFWGLLGVMWIKDLYPRMAKWILKIPNRMGRPLTWALTAFLIVNAIVSCIAVARWAERVSGTPAASGFETFIDQRFPDERMERVFANMRFGRQPAG